MTMRPHPCDVDAVVPSKILLSPDARRCALLLVAVHAVVLWPALLGREWLYTGDTLLFILPYKAEAGRLLASGQWPALSWNLSGGQPLWAHPSAEIADPTTLLFAVLPVGVALALATLVHGVVSGLGMFAAARTLGSSARAATWAALAWTGCGPVVSGWSIKAIPAATLPWVLLGTLSVARGRQGWGWVVGSVALMALHPDPPHVLAVLGICLALMAVRSRSRGDAIRAAAGWVVGGMVAGAFLVPAVLVVMESPRVDTGGWSSSSSLGWRWLELLAPAGMGVPGASGALGGVIREAALRPFVASLYLGGVAWLALLPTRRLHRATMRVLGVFAWLMLLLAHGDVVPGVGPLFTLLHVRFPEKLLLPGYAAVILWASLRLPSVLRRVSRASLVVPAALAGSVIAIPPLVARVIPASPGALQLLGDQWVQGATLGALACFIVVIAAIRAPLASGRVLVACACVEALFSANATLLTAERSAFVPAEDGASRAVACCEPHRTREIAITRSPLDAPPWDSFSQQVRARAGMSPVLRGHRVPVALDAGGFDTIALRGALRGLSALPEQEAEGALAMWGVELLYDDAGQPRALPSPAPRIQGTQAVRVEPAAMDDSNARAKIFAEAPGVVVHAAQFRLGWTASLDGAPVTMRPARGFHVEVDVPAGSHDVVFAYSTPGAFPGFMVSVLGLVAAWAGRRPRRA